MNRTQGILAAGTLTVITLIAILGFGNGFGSLNAASAGSGMEMAAPMGEGSMETDHEYGEEEDEEEEYEDYEEYEEEEHEDDEDESTYEDEEIYEYDD